MTIDADTKKWIRTKADEKAAKAGMRFDVERGEFVCNWIENYCCLYEGAQAGQPLTLLPWQREFVMRLFGWVRYSDEWGEWIRRFTKASLWAAKKNGKTPFIAAIGLYLLAGDGEQGQKVYSAAKNGEQAKLAQQHATAMVEQSPALDADCKLNKSTLNIAHTSTRSAMLILTGENSTGAKAKEGINGSVLIDECFTAGTMIDTPNGPTDIVEVRPGDKVYCATGVAEVLGTSRRDATDLYEVRFSDGTSFTCTGNHRIFTDSGWVHARSLVNGAIAYSPEAVRLLWQGVRAVARGSEEWAERREVDGAERNVVERPNVLLDFLREEIEEPDGQRGDAGEGLADTQEDWSSATRPTWERNAPLAAATCDVARAGRRVGSRVAGSGRDGARQRLPDSLQTRLGSDGIEDRFRVRRRFSRDAGTTGTGREEDVAAERVRVVGVSRVERAGFVPVFNLHVSGHPSYFAEGKLVHNCHVFDREMHERTSRAGISRKEPLNLAVSTAGDDPSSYGYERCQYGRQVNAGERDDPLFLHVEYSAPEKVTDAEIDKRLEEFGKLANPSWGAIVKPSEFRADWESCKGKPREVARFKQYRLNIWVGSTNQWLDTSGWEKGLREIDREELRGRSCRLGFDLSRTRDMTSAVFTFDWPEEGPEAVLVWPLFWLPENTAKNRDHLFPFRSWATAGDLRLTPGDVVDYKIVEDDIVAEVRDLELSVLALFFDQHFAEELSQRLAEELACERTAVPQTLMVLCPLCKEFERRVSVGLVIHPGNKVMSWQVGHCEVWADRNQNIRPVKPAANSGKSIDGVMATIDTMAGVVSATGAANEPTITFV